MIKLKCGGCKKAEGTVTVCSMFGAISYVLCEDCLKSGKENYRNMVNYISCAGHWPQDINEVYQAEVRRQLKLHDKTEEEFRNDVEEAIAEEQAAMIELCSGKLEF
jgi:hypothetical protein